MGAWKAGFVSILQIMDSRLELGNPGFHKGLLGTFSISDNVCFISPGCIGHTEDFVQSKVLKSSSKLI